MNSRRVHELMQKHFPPVEAASREWRNLADVDGVRKESLSALISEFIQSEIVLVEIHRYLGAFLERSKAVEFIAQHIGRNDIRAANREFTGFIYIAANGVGSGWRG